MQYITKDIDYYTESQWITLTVDERPRFHRLNGVRVALFKLHYHTHLLGIQIKSQPLTACLCSPASIHGCNIAADQYIVTYLNSGTLLNYTGEHII